MGTRLPGRGEGAPARALLSLPVGASIPGSSRAKKLSSGCDETGEARIQPEGERETAHSGSHEPSPLPVKRGADEHEPLKIGSTVDYPYPLSAKPNAPIGESPGESGR